MCIVSFIYKFQITVITIYNWINLKIKWVLGFMFVNYKKLYYHICNLLYVK